MKKDIFKVIHDKKYSCWTMEEDRKLLELIRTSDARNKWKKISKLLGKKVLECIKRFKVINPKIKKGLWTSEEDREVIKLSKIYGNNWSKISENLQNKNRTGKQIRQRYLNFLDPSINRTKFTLEEDLKILKLFQVLKSNWKLYTEHFKNRSPDMIKGRYYSSVRYNVNILKIVNTLNVKNNNDDICTNKNCNYINGEKNNELSSKAKKNNTTKPSFKIESSIFINKELNNPSNLTESSVSFNFDKNEIINKNTFRNEIFEEIKGVSSIDDTIARDDLNEDEVDSLLDSGNIILPEILKEIDNLNSFTESEIHTERSQSNQNIILIEEINEFDKKSFTSKKNNGSDILFLNSHTCEETDEFNIESEENFNLVNSQFEEQYDQEFNERFNYFAKQKNTDFLI